MIRLKIYTARENFLISLGKNYRKVHKIRGQHVTKKKKKRPWTINQATSKDREKENKGEAIDGDLKTKSRTKSSAR